MITVGIVTRDRPDALLRNVLSLPRLGPLLREVVIYDDGGTARQMLHAAAVELPPLRFLPVPPGLGNIAGRNMLVRAADTDAVLLMDDDAVIQDAAAIDAGIAALDADLDVAIVAFAQGEPDGSPWPPGMQPAPVDFTCQVAAHIGFAHLVRRTTFLRLGGYREVLFFYGEEKELALRVLDSGGRIVYLPHARVGHLPDPGGRSSSRFLRYTVRNNCIGSVCNDPFPLPLAVVPVRLLQYFTMRRAWRMHDPGGFRWVVREVVRLLPRLLRERKPVRWHTLRRWRALRGQPVPWPPGAAP